MEVRKLLEGPLTDGLAWAMQAACDALPAGAVYEVRQYADNHIAWKQVEDTLPVIGACRPAPATTWKGYLLGRFVAS